MSKSKEEILHEEINKVFGLDQSYDEFLEKLTMNGVSKAAISAMEQYATQQTAALEKEVERLRNIIEDILVHSGTAALTFATHESGINFSVIQAMANKGLQINNDPVVTSVEIK